ncbi:MAG: hypothetical protein P1V20_09980 [Verrucomicrobiales bacterium]|nr:hypothetical protein [Verrucomicrobiales bacterium]
MRLQKTVHRVSLEEPDLWLPWWFRPSLFMLFAMLPGMVLFSFSDPTLTLSKAQLFYGYRDFVVGLIGFFFLIVGAWIGESKTFRKLSFSIFGQNRSGPPPRIAEVFLSEKLDWFLMGVFVFAHLIFFRDFFLNPGLVAGVLGGNLELKHTFKTIPGVTTWTQVSLVLGALRGMRWSGILPGKVKLISGFHIVFFGTLFIRAVLWSERLALIEGAMPFFLCAMPRLGVLLKPAFRRMINFLPLLAPVLLLGVFVFFESLRSWQSNSAEHANIFVFGWKRLFTYYFEAMNTGAAILGVTGFYDGVTMPIYHGTYDIIYKGLYQGSLDIEFNNTSGIWYVATYAGNVLFIPAQIALGMFTGIAYRSLAEGRLFGLVYPIQFLFMFELLRIHYWVGTNRVLPSTLVILLILAWAVTVKSRVRFSTSPVQPAKI